MNQKTHTISTDDFEDYAPRIEVAGIVTACINKKVEVEISFCRDIHSGRDVARAMFIVSSERSEEEPFATAFLDEAIAKYNELA